MKSCVEVVVVESREGSILVMDLAIEAEDGAGDAVLVLPRDGDGLLSAGDTVPSSGSSAPSSRGPLVDRRGIAILFRSS